MGHRHFFRPPYMLEAENDQRWNLTENPYVHTARNGAGESSSLIHPVDNMSIDGAQYTPMSIGYSALAHNLQVPNYQQDVAGPSDLTMRTSTAGGFYIASEDYRNQASSSNYSGNPFNEEDLFDISVGNIRGPYKRKSPGVPDGSERNGASGSSSDVTEPWQDTQSTNILHAPWGYRANNLSIGGENSIRNVRSRAAFDMETNLARDYYTTSRPMDDSPAVNLMDQSSNGLTVEWNPTSSESNPFLIGSSNPNSSVSITRSNQTLQNFHGSSVQSVRGVRSNYIQRPASTFRASSSNDYSSMHPIPRTSSTIGWHTNQGLTIVDRSAFIGSRNPFDQHRDMRLDIDDMSYEELLALGERIGSVGTGLPEHLISKCVQESIFCSSDQIQDEGTCVICLEEYANMDDIGMLKVCYHDFHAGCIRKWLSIKNLCPICKSEPVKQK